MMIFGMLYFDSTYKLSELALIEIARKAFERRVELKASLALLSINSENLPEVDGLMVNRSYLVRPNHVIVGVPVQDNPPKKLANPNSQ